MIARLLFNTLVLVAVGFFPWWIVLPLIFFGIILFENYFEALIFSYVYDLLFAPLRLFPFVTLGSIIVFLSFLYFKKHLTFY